MKLSLKLIIALLCLGLYQTGKAQGQINITFQNRHVDYVNKVWTFDLFAAAGTGYLTNAGYNNWAYGNIRCDMAVASGITFSTTQISTGVANKAYMDTASAQIAVAGTPPTGSIEFGVALQRTSQADLTATPVRLATFTFYFNSTGGAVLTGNELITPRNDLSVGGSFWTNGSSQSGGSAQYYSMPSNFTLPITLENFTATKSGTSVNLNWLISSEINAKGYEVERSGNGLNFTSIDKVAATGKSNYSSIDAAPLNGLNYYRLKMLDKDGKFKYSAVRTVLFDGRAVVFDIFPNPAVSNKVNLHLQQYDYEGKAQAIIKDMLGRSIQTTGVNIVKGNNQLPIVLTGLNSGTYFVTLHTSNGTVIAEPIKFVKQ